jgi:hypothetical protein
MKTLSSIQMKTCQGTRPIWILNAKAELDVAENLFYVFVCLLAQGEPSFYVVPRATVAQFVRDDHRKWKATLGPTGKSHGDSNVRKFKDPDGAYKNKWELLPL